MDLGVQPGKKWTEIRSICDNFGDGGYTLPVPDSQEYHDALVTRAGGNSVALGFSDEQQEGNFVNIYNSTNIHVQLNNY